MNEFNEMNEVNETNEINIINEMNGINAVNEINEMKWYEWNKWNKWIITEMNDMNHINYVDHVIYAMCIILMRFTIFQTLLWESEAHRSISCSPEHMTSLNDVDNECILSLLTYCHYFIEIRHNLNEHKST